MQVTQCLRRNDRGPSSTARGPWTQSWIFSQIQTKLGQQEAIECDSSLSGQDWFSTSSAPPWNQSSWRKGTPWFLTPSGIFSGVRPTSLSSTAFLSPRPSAQASLPSLTWTPASTGESFSWILWDAHSLLWTVASRGCCVSLVNPWLCLVWGRVPHVYHWPLTLEAGNPLSDLGNSHLYVWNHNSHTYTFPSSAVLFCGFGDCHRVVAHIITNSRTFLSPWRETHSPTAVSRFLVPPYPGNHGQQSNFCLAIANYNGLHAFFFFPAAFQKLAQTWDCSLKFLYALKRIASVVWMHMHI